MKVSFTFRKQAFNTKTIEANRTSQVGTYRQAWLNGKLFNEYPTDRILVKLNSRKLQLIIEKSYEMNPYWQIGIKYQIFSAINRKYYLK